MCCPSGGLFIESWAWLPLMVTVKGSPSTVMVTCSPEWLVSVRVSLACNLLPPPPDLQRTWKETRSPHGMPPPPETNDAHFVMLISLAPVSAS